MVRPLACTYVCLEINEGDGGHWSVRSFSRVKMTIPARLLEPPSIRVLTFLAMIRVPNAPGPWRGQITLLTTCSVGGRSWE